MENNIDLKDLEKMLKMEAKRFTPEYLEECSKNAYKEDREYPENFSNWYPHIKNFGDFKHTEIVSNQIFTWEEVEIMQETDNIDKVDWDKLNKILEPTLSKMDNYKLYNIKNGCFSNKFDFETCLATKENLARKLWEINYQSSMFETGGYTELVVRKLIPHTDSSERMTIYNGMPLRDEVRVFYNMETKEIEYVVDYWDYEYCHNNLSKVSDRIVFDYFHGKLQKDDKTYTDHNDFMGYVMESQLQEKIKTLEFDGKLSGIWSIDFLIEDAEWYLIDMARGFRSAYWDFNKLKQETQKRLREENE